MEGIKIDSGIERVPVSVDGIDVGELTFNPHDLILVEKIHRLYFELKQKELESSKSTGDIKEPELDERGMPLEITEMSEPIKELNYWIRGKIDNLFGVGTSQRIYGDVLYLDEKIHVYGQLIGAVIDFIGPVRAEKIAQYTTPAAIKRNGRKRNGRTRK